MADPADLFDASMAESVPGAELRHETEADSDFLTALFVACSPLTGQLPEAMVLQQADIAVRSFRSSFPDAMRRILIVDDRPVGRIIIDWQHGKTAHCVDIAVMPDVQKTGLGGAMLQSWISVADLLERPCSLEVMFNNPALQLYQRLGFAPTPQMDGSQMSIEMKRPAG